MGTAAFVALLMVLCNKKYTATQFALLSALASIGRVFVGPLAGEIAFNFDWPIFFYFLSLPRSLEYLCYLPSENKLKKFSEVMNYHPLYV